MSDANFPSILVSRRGTKQARTDKENYFDKSFICISIQTKELYKPLHFIIK